MKQIIVRCSFFALALLIGFTSCHKAAVKPARVIDTSATATVTANGLGLYVLNYGNYNVLNEAYSSLTYYDQTSGNLIPDLYSKVNGSKLGSGSQAIGVYGSKMYIWASGALHVLNIKSSKLLEKDTLDGGSCVTFYKNNAFVGGEGGGFAVLDTASYTYNNSHLIGTGDGIADAILILNGKLYVLSNNAEDSSNMSVTDLSSLTVTKSILLSGLANSFAADPYGNLYVVSAATNFHSSTFYGEGLTIIDDVADTVKSFQTISIIGKIFAQGDFIYYSTAGGKIVKYNAKTQAIDQDNFIADGTVITSPYAISGNPLTGEIFISDVKDGLSNGELFAFDKTGKKEYSFITGINPYSIVLVNK